MKTTVDNHVVLEIAVSFAIQCNIRSFNGSLKGLLNYSKNKFMSCLKPGHYLPCEDADKYRLVIIDVQTC